MTSFANAKQLLFDPEFVPDKVIYRKSVTYTVAEATTLGDYHEFTFAHGLPFIPLLIGTYSDDGFATSYDYGIGPYGRLTAFGFDSYTMLAHVWADSTNVTIRAISFNATRDITFHIVGLSPGISPDGFGGIGYADIDIPPIQDDLLFTTDSNTLKHYSWISTSMTTNGLGTFVTRGYTTQVDTPLTMLCFIKEDGKVSYMNTMNSITISGVNLSVLSRPNSLTVGVESSSVKTVDVIIKTYIDD